MTTPTPPTTPPIAPITEDDIAEFLIQTPGFFERHAEVLASVQLTSPHGGRAVSLQERQAELLREKIKGLELRIMDMVRHSSENAAIAHKVHQWGLALLQTADAHDLPQAVVDGLCTLFDVPQVALRVWDVAESYAQAPFAQGASADVQAFASSLTMPFCGPNLGFEATAWLPDARRWRRSRCCRCALAPSKAPRRRWACWCWARPTRSVFRPPWVRNSSRASPSSRARRSCACAERYGAPRRAATAFLRHHRVRTRFDRACRNCDHACGPVPG